MATITNLDINLGAVTTKLNSNLAAGKRIVDGFLSSVTSGFTGLQDTIGKTTQFNDALGSSADALAAISNGMAVGATKADKFAAALASFDTARSFGNWLSGANEDLEKFIAGISKAQEQAKAVSKLFNQQDANRRFELSLIRDPAEQKRQLEEFARQAEKQMFAASQAAFKARADFDKFNTTLRSLTGNKELERLRSNMELAQNQADLAQKSFQNWTKQVNEFGQRMQANARFDALDNDRKVRERMSKEAQQMVENQARLEKRIESQRQREREVTMRKERRRDQMIFAQRVREITEQRKLEHEQIEDRIKQRQMEMGNAGPVSAASFGSTDAISAILGARRASSTNSDPELAALEEQLKEQRKQTRALANLGKQQAVVVSIAGIGAG